MENKLDYKLVNFVLLVFIIYLIYQTKAFWLGVVGVSLEILLPFLIAFSISYALYPIVAWLIKHKTPKGFSILLVIAFFLGSFGFLLYLITPIFVEQATSIFDSIVTFFKDISSNNNFNYIEDNLGTTFSNVLEKIGTYISNGAISIIGLSLKIVSQILIIIAAIIYFLIDMDKIKNKIKQKLINKKLYKYVAIIDRELTDFLSGFIKIVFISFVEYTILYMVIGHPNALMLGTLAAFGNFIPYFGGIITNIIAAITAFVISPELFIKALIVFVIFSAIDGYVINPFVYGKSNRIHPLIVIVSVFAGGILFGIIGIIIALPVSIIIITTYKFFKKDIDEFSHRKLHVKKELKQ